VESDADVVAAQRRGTVVFAGLELEVGEGVLVPRAETELVAAVAIEIALATPRAPIVVDVGTGAANLACAIATRDPRARVIAIDVAPAAVALARRNVERLGLDARVTVTLGDALAPLEALGLADAAVDLVVCNPPYISTRRLDERADLTRREPREAFDGGPYGLALHGRVTRDAARALAPGGWLAMEMGVGQADQVARLVARAPAFEPPCFTADARGEPRVVRARKRSEPR
jgi:release factor glutamine methyltransferase